MNKQFQAAAVMVAVGCLVSAQSRAASKAHFAVGPDCNQELLLSTIASTTDSLDINIYEIKSEKITKAIVDRIKDGVTVRMLVEGQPVGGVSQIEKKNLDKIRDAMSAQRNSDNKLYIMTGERADRRYVYDHAKYLVADGSTVLVSSDNFSPTGHSDPHTVGNRGWDIVIENNAALAKKLTRMFEGDADPDAGDVVSVAKGDRMPVKEAKSDAEGVAKQRTNDSFAVGDGTVDGAELVVSPKSEPGLVKFIRSAQEHLEIQHMSFPSQWRVSSSSDPTPSPLVSEAVAAAQRGVKVRVLLNDESSFGGGESEVEETSKPNSNQATVDFINKVAKQKKLPISAKLIDYKAVQITYIHNKGMLADGRYSLVSSINGTRNSVYNNREVALSVDSVDANEYYQQAFDFDWTTSRVRRSAVAQAPADFFVMPALSEWAL